MNVVKFCYSEVLLRVLYYKSYVTKRTSRFVLSRFPVSPDSSRYMDDLIYQGPLNFGNIFQP